MGEGKSSVVIPIAAAALADGKQLVRVIVPKASTIQIFELLLARLGGLTNKPIYHLPFSRVPEAFIHATGSRLVLDHRDKTRANVGHGGIRGVEKLMANKNFTDSVPIVTRRNMSAP